MDRPEELLQTPAHIARQLDGDTGWHHRDDRKPTLTLEPAPKPKKSKLSWVPVGIGLASAITALTFSIMVNNHVGVSSHDVTDNGIPTPSDERDYTFYMPPPPPACDDSIRNVCIPVPAKLPIGGPPFGTVNPDSSVVARILSSLPLKHPRTGHVSEPWGLPVLGESDGSFVRHAVCNIHPSGQLVEVGTDPEAPGLVLAQYIGSSNQPPAMGDCSRTDRFWANEAWFPPKSCIQLGFCADPSEGHDTLPSVPGVPPTPPAVHAPTSDTSLPGSGLPVCSVNCNAPSDGHVDKPN
jgi:hypothetical protein